MHTSSEGTVLDFNCTLIQSRVQIRMEHQLNFSRTGKRMGSQRSSIDCSCKDQCPIAYRDEAGDPRYDWSRCVYVSPPKPAEA